MSSNRPSKKTSPLPTEEEIKAFLDLQKQAKNDLENWNTLDKTEKENAKKIFTELAQKTSAITRIYRLKKIELLPEWIDNTTLNALQENLQKKLNPPKPFIEEEFNQLKVSIEEGKNDLDIGKSKKELKRFSEQLKQSIEEKTNLPPWITQDSLIFWLDSSLTHKDKANIDIIADVLSNRDISDQIFLGSKTPENLIKHIFEQDEVKIKPIVYAYLKKKSDIAPYYIEKEAANYLEEKINKEKSLQVKLLQQQALSSLEKKWNEIKKTLLKDYSQAEKSNIPDISSKFNQILFIFLYPLPPFIHRKDLFKLVNYYPIYVTGITTTQPQLSLLLDALFFKDSPKKNRTIRTNIINTLKQIQCFDQGQKEEITASLAKEKKGSIKLYLPKEHVLSNDSYFLQEKLLLGLFEHLEKPAKTAKAKNEANFAAKSLLILFLELDGKLPQPLQKYESEMLDFFDRLLEIYAKESKEIQESLEKSWNDFFVQPDEKNIIIGNHPDKSKKLVHLVSLINKADEYEKNNLKAEQKLQTEAEKQREDKEKKQHELEKQRLREEKQRQRDEEKQKRELEEKRRQEENQHIKEENQRKQEEEKQRKAEEARQKKEVEARKKQEAEEKIAEEIKQEQETVRTHALKTLLTALKQMTGYAKSNAAAREGNYHFFKREPDDFTDLVSKIKENIGELKEEQTTVLLPKQVHCKIIPVDENTSQRLAHELRITTEEAKQALEQPIADAKANISEGEAPRLQKNQLAINIVGDLQHPKACFTIQRVDDKFFYGMPKLSPANDNDLLEIANDLCLSFIRDLGAKQTFNIYPNSNKRMTCALILLCKAQNISYNNESRIDYVPSNNEVLFVKNLIAQGTLEKEMELSVENELTALKDLEPKIHNQAVKNKLQNITKQVETALNREHVAPDEIYQLIEGVQKPPRP